MVALAIVLLVIILLLLLPVGAEGAFTDGELSLSAKVGPVKVRILPKKEKKNKKEKPPKAKKKRKPKKKLTGKDISDIAKIALRALARFRRHVSIDYLMLHITAAKDDPCDTALLYAGVSAALGTAMPLVRAAFHIRREDVGAATNFLSGETKADAALTATIRVYEVLHIVNCAAFAYLAWRHRAKKREKAAAADTKSEKGC